MESLHSLAPVSPIIPPFGSGSPDKGILTILPAEVRQSALNCAEASGETLVGWKAITEDVPCSMGRRVRPVRYLFVTNKGYYEVSPDGTFVRAAVLHGF